jgi:hypothetical protein
MYSWRRLLEKYLDSGWKQETSTRNLIAQSSVRQNDAHGWETAAGYLPM